jgi:hypothetical protein
MLKTIRIVCIGGVLAVAAASFVAGVETAAAQSQSGAAKKSAKKPANRAVPATAPRGTGSSQNVDRSEFATSASGMADRHDARNGY